MAGRPLRRARIARRNSFREQRARELAVERLVEEYMRLDGIATTATQEASEQDEGVFHVLLSQTFPELAEQWGDGLLSWCGLHALLRREPEFKQQEQKYFWGVIGVSPRAEVREFRPRPDRKR